MSIIGSGFESIALDDERSTYEESNPSHHTQEQQLPFALFHSSKDAIENEGSPPTSLFESGLQKCRPDLAGWSTMTNETMKTEASLDSVVSKEAIHHSGLSHLSSLSLSFRDSHHLSNGAYSPSATTPDSTTKRPYRSRASKEPLATGSLRFSQLMDQADDRHELMTKPLKLPVLPENSDGPMGMGASVQTVQTLTSSEFNAHRAPVLTPSVSSPSQLLDRQEVAREVNIEHQGDNAFCVSLQIDSTRTALDVMNILSSPDMLRLWNESVKSLIVTRSSERSSQLNEPERRYDGEWIEATASLRSPPTAVGLVHSAANSVWSLVGFPSVAKVNMFTEHERFTMNLSMGPFDGGVFSSHQFSVSEYNGVLRIVDTVKVTTKSEDNSSSLSCHSAFWKNVVLKCFMETQVQGQIDQAAESLRNLSLLVETRDQSGSQHNTGQTIVLGNEDSSANLPLLSDLNR